RDGAMKCNKCPNAATLHITEIVSEDHVEELHLCEVCAHKSLSEPQPKHAGKSSATSPLDDLDSPGPVRECEMCGIKFVDFRNTHRLGCPHDYVVFREELVQLLEKIHGETRHGGKGPRRPPHDPPAPGRVGEPRKPVRPA